VNYVEQLKNIRNECIFNSQVMFSSVKGIKKQNERSRRIAYLINIIVVATTLLSVLFSLKDFEKLACASGVSSFMSLLAFGFSVSIFLAYRDYDSRVDYTIANSYWLLHSRCQDLIQLVGSENGECKILDEKINGIKREQEQLIRLSPTFKSEDVKDACKKLRRGNFLYLAEEDMNEIIAFFKNKDCNRG